MSRMLAAIGLVGAVVLLAAGGCALAVHLWASGPTCGNNPREMFEGVLLKPVPDGVSDLQGVGDVWQSYSVWLRFKATDAAVAEILADGFAPASRSEAEPLFRLPGGYDRVRPSWSPPVGRGECFRASRRCPWSTSGGRQWLLIDRAAGTVYVYAEGH